MNGLKPGGWLEMQEFDVWFQSEEGELPADSAIMEWQKYLDEASGMFGKKLNVARDMAGWMSEVGFEDVREDVVKVRLSFCHTLLFRYTKGLADNYTTSPVLVSITELK